MVVAFPSGSRLLRIALTCAAFFAAGAHAELGGNLSGVRADSDHMAVRLASVALGSYSRHELVRPNGGAVHEFTNARGQVFAVTWAGPGKPDLRALLGRYFTTFQNANIAIGRTMHALRRPPQVSQPDLQIQTSGHMGWFRGIAFVPSLAPSDFSAANLTMER